MNLVMLQLASFVEAMAKQAKVRKAVFSILGIFFVLQVYFVRELIAAELLFLLVFAVILTLGGIFYVLGTIGEQGLDLGEVGVRVLAQSARRGYVFAEEISRKALRNPTESAQ